MWQLENLSVTQHSEEIKEKIPSKDPIKTYPGINTVLCVVKIKRQMTNWEKYLQLNQYGTKFLRVQALNHQQQKKN